MNQTSTNVRILLYLINWDCLNKFIHLSFVEILAKKIENKCWWCKSDKCTIVNVDDTEVIKNYSDAAVA